MFDGDERPAGDEFFFLWVLIAQTRDAVLLAREREYERYGISNERRAILYIIQNNGGQTTPVEIARDLFRELHSVTEMLKRMEKDGLVRRTKGRGRSKVLISLTEEGLDVLKQSLHNEIDRNLFSVLTKSERERLIKYLWKLRGKALQDLGIPEWRLSLQMDPDDNGIHMNGPRSAVPPGP